LIEISTINGIVLEIVVVSVKIIDVMMVVIYVVVVFEMVMVTTTMIAMFVVVIMIVSMSINVNIAIVGRGLVMLYDVIKFVTIVIINIIVMLDRSFMRKSCKCWKIVVESHWKRRKGC
jgi:hypothetical protein